MLTAGVVREVRLCVFLKARCFGFFFFFSVDQNNSQKNFFKKLGQFIATQVLLVSLEKTGNFCKTN